MSGARGSWKQSVLKKQSSGSYVSVGIASLNSVYENVYLTSGIVYVLFYQVHDVQIP